MVCVFRACRHYALHLILSPTMDFAPLGLQALGTHLVVDGNGKSCQFQEGASYGIEGSSIAMQSVQLWIFLGCGDRY
jgi:hypothetical protein